MLYGTKYPFLTGQGIIAAAPPDVLGVNESVTLIGMDLAGKVIADPEGIGFQGGPDFTPVTSNLVNITTLTVLHASFEKIGSRLVEVYLLVELTPTATAIQTFDVRVPVGGFAAVADVAALIGNLNGADATLNTVQWAAVGGSAGVPAPYQMRWQYILES